MFYAIYFILKYSWKFWEVMKLTSFLSFKIYQPSTVTSFLIACSPSHNYLIDGNSQLQLSDLNANVP